MIGLEAPRKFDLSSPAAVGKFYAYQFSSFCWCRISGMNVL
jgi:hypothetical protein